MAYLMHAYVTMSDCTLISVGDRPEESIHAAAEIEMPQEWTDETFAKLCYRVPDGRMLEVAILQADTNLVLHWYPFDPSDSQQAGDVYSTTVSAVGFFSESQSSSDAYIKGKLKELIDTFAPGIDLILQGNQSAAQGVSTADARPSEPTAADEPGHRAPDTDRRPDPIMPVHPHLPHQPRHPQGSGMHVGPDDPIFTDPLADPRFPQSLPPGARFDPIAPPGLPGSHPDDFTGMGPSQRDGWHDIGPPPGGFPGVGGGRLPGRRGRGGPGFGGPGGFGGGGFL